MGIREIELTPEEAKLKLPDSGIRPVRLFPDPVLKARCQQIVDFTPEVLSLVDALSETMRGLPGCVGLAAPQLGANMRIVVVDVTRSQRRRDPNHGFTCMINPMIVQADGEQISREGCASIPDFTANVTRHARVAIDYLDCDGNTKALEAEGFEAIAFQHEIDHLDGILFLDRVRPSDVFHRKRAA